jgi:hypothetical protein
MLTAASGRDLRTAGDMAAVLYWRLPELAPVDPGPLPWLPGIPETLCSHPGWGPYLTRRSQLVADLAAQVQDHAYQSDGPPVWAPHPSTALVGEIAVWRAANGAGVIFANYDGVHKSTSTVGAYSFVGSNAVLAAPVEIADGAYIAAGSTITGDVGPGELAVSRGRQRNVPGWVARRRAGTKTARAAEAAQRQEDPS